MASAGFANNKLFRRELLDGVRFAEEGLSLAVVPLEYNEKVGPGLVRLPMEDPRFSLPPVRNGLHH